MSANSAHQVVNPSSEFDLPVARVPLANFFRTVAYHVQPDVILDPWQYVPGNHFERINVCGNLEVADKYGTRTNLREFGYFAGKVFVINSYRKRERLFGAHGIVDLLSLNRRSEHNVVAAIVKTPFPLFTSVSLRAKYETLYGCKTC